MERFYCPHCDVFKNTKLTARDGFYGFVYYYCRCCGTRLIDTKRVLEQKDKEYIRSYAKSLAD